MAARVVAVLLALVLAQVATAAGAEEATITPDELAERIESGDAPLVLDVRTPSEFREGHIPGAVNIPHDKVGLRIDEIAEYRDREVVVHCRMGPRARKAEDVLTQAGFTKVVELKGNWMGWRANGYPEVKGDQSDPGAQVGGSK